MNNWEIVTLGTVIHDPVTMEVAQELAPQDFTGSNRLVWVEVLALHRRGSLEKRALVEALRAKNLLEGIGLDLNGGDQYGEAYIDFCISYHGAQIEEYVRQVVDLAVRRQLRETAGLIAADAMSTRPSDELLDEAERRVMALRRTRDVGGSDLGTILRAFMPRLEGMRTGAIQPALVPNTQALKDVIGYIDWSDFVLVAGRPGDGKCLSAGTRVIMASGEPRAVEALQVGDQLMGPDSTPRTILATASGVDMMYWVHQNRAMDYRVNAAHVLSVKRSKNEDGHHHGDQGELIAEECAERSLMRWKGWKTGFELPEKDVPLEPYFLGLWLGDGTSSNSTVTTIEPEVVRYLQDYADRLGHRLHSYKLSHRITHHQGSRDCITSHLSCMGLLNNKQIPERYLRNSRRVRWELLAGLIDSDGCLVHSGIEITMVDERLIRQIKRLADSLGLRTSKNITGRTVHCQTGATAIAYRVILHGDFSECPIRVPRRRPAPSRGVDKALTGIRVVRDRVDRYYGFELDGDGLFLLEDGTVTHNSSFMRYEAYTAARHNLPVLVFNLENDESEYAKNAIALKTAIDSDKIRNPRMLSQQELERVRTAAQELVNLPVKVVTMGAPSVAELERIARAQMRTFKPRLIQVDYIQLVQNGIENPVANLSLTSQTLRAWAMRNRLNIPVMAAAQLSRAIEQRGPRSEPQLSDLRDSGSLEQDATMVWFLREAWYMPDVRDLRRFPENIDHITGNLYPTIKASPIRIYVRKNRNGPTGVTGEIKWVKSTGAFQTLAHEETR